MPKYATASDLPFYDIFVPQKVPLSKISDDVMACDLWFGPPNQKSWPRLWYHARYKPRIIPFCSTLGGYGALIIAITKILTLNQSSLSDALLQNE